MFVYIYICSLEYDGLLFVYSVCICFCCLLFLYSGGWGPLDREIVPICSCVRTGGLVAYSGIGSQKLLVGLFPFPFGPWVVLGNHLT